MCYAAAAAGQQPRQPAGKQLAAAKSVIRQAQQPAGNAAQSWMEAG